MSDTVRELVERLVAAGEWPEPQLLEDILAQGQAAVEPLREVVRRDVHGWPEEAPLCFAIDLLGTLGAVEAIPDLIALFSRYDNETLQSASTTLGLLGPPAFEALLGVVRNASLNPYQRTEASSGAIMASGGNEDLRQRVAAALREVLADYVARAPDLTEEEMEMASFLVTDLTQLTDPQAREIIDTAFKADIVDQGLMRPEDVEHYYKRQREEIPRPEPRAWLEEYKELYEDEMRAREELARRPPATEEDWGDEGLDEDEEWEDEEWEGDEEWEDRGPRVDPQKQLPFEHSGPRLGRNDPCWCGSGKKYKNCHLERDRANG
jgi:hypothetical protein